MVCGFLPCCVLFQRPRQDPAGTRDESPHMPSRRPPVHVLFCLLWLAGSSAVSALIPERNLWPAFVGEPDPQQERYERWQGAGPLFFARDVADTRAYGLRPLYVVFHQEEYDQRSFHVLYPLFNYRRRHLGYSWDVLTLLRYHRTGSPSDDPLVNLRLSPIFFYGRGPQPEDDSFGVMPIYGDVHTVFGQDRFQWVLFPLYARAEKDGRVLTMAPWPFFRIYRGEDAGGFDIWPFYGQRRIDDDYERRYFLWPLGYHTRRELWKDEPYVAHGFLPFYSRSRSDRAESATYVWPFFGYTRSEDPEYLEIRYFWPLMVQRRGENQYTNRIAPFYTRSIRRHRDRQWILWPFYRHEKTANRNLLEERTQFLYFLYWSLKQSDPARPEAESAHRRHLWPLFSNWSDGAGRRQTQLISPLEVFFQHNEIVRTTYTPLFALYQRDVDRTEDRSRHALLFQLLTWQRRADDYRLNLGPLLTVEREDEHRGFEILKGLVGYEQDRGLTIFWLDLFRNEDEDPEDDRE